MTSVNLVEHLHKSVTEKLITAIQKQKSNFTNTIVDDQAYLHSWTEVFSIVDVVVVIVVNVVIYIVFQISLLPLHLSKQ